MQTNYEILMQCSRKQIEQFIRSIVNKEESKYINWRKWLNSEEPEAVYFGEEALLRREDGTTEPCRLIGTMEENGEQFCRYYIIREHGEIEDAVVPAAMILSSEKETAVETVAETEAEPEETETAEPEEMESVEPEEAETVEEEEPAAAEPETPAVDSTITFEVPHTEKPAKENTLDFHLDFDFDDLMDDLPVEGKPQPEVTKVIRTDEFQVGELLSEIKEKSPYFDPDDPEDLELPTIAFTAITDEKDRF